jgi:hypothetical protein
LQAEKLLHEAPARRYGKSWHGGCKTIQCCARCPGRAACHDHTPASRPNEPDHTVTWLNDAPWIQLFRKLILQG